MTERAPSPGFRRLCDALIAKKFKSHDDMPVVVKAVSGLFIGSYGAASNLEALMHSSITHILCVSPSLPLNFPGAFTYLRLPVADQSSTSISKYFDEAFGFINSAISSGGKVLVHCYMGRSRSATIVLAYLMAHREFTLTGALQELRQVRPQAQPNSGFYQELMAIEAKQKRRRDSTRNSNLCEGRP